MRNDKFKAYKLRVQGRSYNEINKLLSVPKSTLSDWFSKLVLPQEAQDRLKKRVYEKSIKALLKRNMAQTRTAQLRAQTIRGNAVKDIGNLSMRDLFIAGIA